MFSDFSVFYEILLLPQVKQCAIITYKHGISELLQELLYNLRLKDLSKLGNVRKLIKLHKTID